MVAIFWRVCDEALTPEWKPRGREEFDPLLPNEDEIESCCADLAALHEEIDCEVQQLAARHAPRLQCRRGCGACCLDDLTVTTIEAEGIRRAHPALLSEGKPHPPGRCAFLGSEGDCRIYAERPSVCRSQGLPLRVVFENVAGELEELRDICELNVEGGPPLSALDEEDCWLVGVVELRLIALEERFVGGESPRASLRGLFARR